MYTVIVGTVGYMPDNYYTDIEDLEDLESVIEDIQELYYDCDDDIVMPEQLGMCYLGTIETSCLDTYVELHESQD